jgi:hypothetical protein
MHDTHDTERPPPPLPEMARVADGQTTDVHLAARSAPPFFCSPRTLCGRDVVALSATGDDCSCEKCLAALNVSA